LAYCQISIPGFGHHDERDEKQREAPKLFPPGLDLLVKKEDHPLSYVPYFPSFSAS